MPRHAELAVQKELERLCEIMASPHDAPPKWLFMLTVYLDESGHETPEYVVIAGFVGTDEQWGKFLLDWRVALGKNPSFHANKVRWEHPSTKARLVMLGAIPHKHGLRALVGAVKVSDYADLLSNPAEQYVLQGYGMALYPIIHALLAATPVHERIKWVFEEQRQYGELARAVFRGYEGAEAKHRVSDISFVPKSSTCLTQPADFLAYAVLQQLRDPNSKRARWSKPIFGGVPYLGMIVGREMIRGILSKSLAEASYLTELQTGKNPTEVFKKYPNKKEVREILRKVPHGNR